MGVLKKIPKKGSMPIKAAYIMLFRYGIHSEDKMPPDIRLVPLLWFPVVKILESGSISVAAL